MIDPAAFLFLALTSSGAFLQVWATVSLTALYGETIVIPCNGSAPAPEDLIFVKWKYEKDDGSLGDLLIQQAHSNQHTVQAIDDYAHRVSIDDKFSLLIVKASLKDQKTFTCMVVSDANLMEYPVSVLVYKQPSPVQIIDKSEALQKDRLTLLGTCVAMDAHPAASITWNKNGEALIADGKVVVITPSRKLDPATGLSTTLSTLQYAATKDDADAEFACISTHELINQETKLEPFTIHYPPEKVNLQVMSNGPLVEGDNVTLKCHSDGNPPPNSFFFYIKDQKLFVENSDNYTLHAINREAAGQYKCSLADNEKIEDSQNIVINYLDLNLNPTGEIVKRKGDTLSVKMEKIASGNVTISWTKDGKAATEPVFSNLTYTDAGVYVCEASVTGVTKLQSFTLVVEGKPVITSLTEQPAEDGDHKVLTCVAEGVPHPVFQWNGNSTNEKISYTNGKATQNITVIPRGNTTVTCKVINALGVDVMSINITSVSLRENDKGPQESEDQSTVIVGVVAGLLLIVAVVALATGYWLCKRKSRRGSWDTAEKELGNTEETKKLEQKA
ncbi:uncharacterized protein V6R79_010849 [Siganus canaliculatus]